ncbi:MAG TPA: hypothetical protein VE198_22300, partial [Actinoallomurus sp.]|nr:hypothetical protein [Actinoallomurus sp.]
TIWLDPANRPAPPPNPHLHTVVDTVAAAAASVVGLGLLLAVAYMLIERRLNRRRFAGWEQEWISIAPRWTGRP